MAFQGGCGVYNHLGLRRFRGLGNLELSVLGPLLALRGFGVEASRVWCFRRGALGLRAQGLRRFEAVGLRVPKVKKAWGVSQSKPRSHMKHR